MNAWIDRYWHTPDGLRLHLRDYDYPARAGTRPDRPPLVCLPGLTRNARDFHALALHFMGDWRVLTPEMRGRGDSDHAADSATYNIPQYIADVAALLADQRIERFVAVGTSLGGLMTMAMAGGMAAKIAPHRIAGAVLNDIGPALEPAGLTHIMSYLGKDQRFGSWDAAAAHLRGVGQAAFPGRDADGWVASARRLMRQDADGTIRFDYDPRIAEPFSAPPPPLGDLWAAWRALAQVPVLVVRGGLSDLFSAETLAEMLRQNPAAQAITVSDQGHAPELDEPAVATAIAALLDRVR